jgi:hypothetical protein
MGHGKDLSPRHGREVVRRGTSQQLYLLVFGATRQCRSPHILLIVTLFDTPGAGCVADSALATFGDACLLTKKEPARWIDEAYTCPKIPFNYSKIY